VTGRRGRRRRKLLDDLKERRGYCHVKEEAVDRTVWRVGFGRGFGPVVRQTAECENITTRMVLQYSCLYRASMTIKTLYYPTDAQIYNS
jgi:hypothetical protein